MKTIEKVGQITVSSEPEKKQNYKGAEYLRALVDWINNRSEHLNENKSNLKLMNEFNNIKK